MTSFSAAASSSVASSSASEATGNSSDQAAPSASSSSSSVQADWRRKRCRLFAYADARTRHLWRLGRTLHVLYGEERKQESRCSRLANIGVPCVNSSQRNAHCRRTVACYDKAIKRSDRSEGQLDKYRRMPVPVVSEDGGGAVMAAIYGDDGVNDGSDESARVVHIATEGFRDVDRYNVQLKRAERASATDVAGATPSRRSCCSRTTSTWGFCMRIRPPSHPMRMPMCAQLQSHARYCVCTHRHARTHVDRPALRRVSLERLWDELVHHVSRFHPNAHLNPHPHAPMRADTRVRGHAVEHVQRIPHLHSDRLSSHRRRDRLGSHRRRDSSGVLAVLCFAAERKMIENPFEVSLYH